MAKKEQIYEVEIKSQALLREGKKSFITYFKGGRHKTIVMNVQKLYPQYTNPIDKPNIGITKISMEEYQNRAVTGVIKQKAHLMKVRGDFSEIMGN